jgi:hypothetical protein
MNYGLRTASCGRVPPATRIRECGTVEDAAINQRTAVLRQRRRELAILTVRVDTEHRAHAEGMGKNAIT